MARSRAPNSTLGDSRSASSPLPGGPVGLARASAWLHEERFLQVPDVTELATTAGVHPTELACMFRAHYGESIGEYARRLRLEWAAERLAGTDIGLASLAAEAGFADQSHFTRAFRRLYGLPPGRYRTAHR
jgi:AraC family transcriptional regulator